MWRSGNWLGMGLSALQRTAKPHAVNTVQWISNLETKEHNKLFPHRNKTAGANDLGTDCDATIAVILQLILPNGSYIFLELVPMILLAHQEDFSNGALAAVQPEVRRDSGRYICVYLRNHLQLPASLIMGC